MKSEIYYNKEKTLKATVIYELSGSTYYPKIKDVECLKHEFKTYKYTAINGRLFYKKRCDNCLRFDGGQIKHSSIENIENVHFDNTPDNLHEHSFSIELRKTLVQKRNEYEYEIYREYYLSDLWKRKRIKVLKRDNHLCQACLTNKATEVHHLTYNNFMDEPLFELISLCHRCHDKIENKKFENGKTKF